MRTLSLNELELVAGGHSRHPVEQEYGGSNAGSLAFVFMGGSASLVSSAIAGAVWGAKVGGLVGAGVGIGVGVGYTLATRSR